MLLRLAYRSFGILLIQFDIEAVPMSPPSPSIPLRNLNNPEVRVTSSSECHSPEKSPIRRNVGHRHVQSLGLPHDSPYTLSLNLSGHSFSSVGANEASTELLLPPTQHQKGPRDTLSPAHSLASVLSGRLRTSPPPSNSSSRKVSPRSPSRSPSITSDGKEINTQTALSKFDIYPSSRLLILPEEREYDDWMHDPGFTGKRSRKWRPISGVCLLDCGGLALITIGVLILFVGYPIMKYVRQLSPPPSRTCEMDPSCISDKLPLLKNVRLTTIDPDTPFSARRRKDKRGKTQKLVFSDEFNRDGRTFYPQDDPYFQAVDLWYGVTQDLEWYDPDAIITKDGVLDIRFDAFRNHGVDYRSGMLQSWNQLCFKGGYLEASVSLPGRGDTIGFWPGVWSMGNLGRPGHASTTDGMWPYSYWDKCDLGITKNQSSPDGLSFLPGMRLPACTCNGSDHPSPTRSRSTPEIDAIEASVGFLTQSNVDAIGTASQSAQFAPFDIWYQPDYDFVSIRDPQITKMNDYRGGYFQEAISGVTNLNNDWYEGKAYQTYSFEYTPGDKGYITWYVGKDASWSLEAQAVGPNGNIGQRIISEEPMALVINFGMSQSFAYLNMTGIESTLPATMRIDYIRVYQDETGHLTCDPPGYETTKYIKDHPKSYLNPNMTTWSQTGYEWPKNSFVDGCSS